MKKVVCYLMFAMLLVFPAQPKAAESFSVLEDLTQGIPDDWITYVKTDNNSQICSTSKDGKEALSMQGKYSYPILSCATPSFNISGINKVYFSCTFSTAAYNDIKAYRYMRLIWDVNTVNSVPSDQQAELLRISANNVIESSGGAVISLVNNQEYYVVFELDFTSSNCSCTTYLDGEQIEVKTLPSGINTSAVRMNFHNTYRLSSTEASIANAAYSDFDLYSVAISESSAFNVSSNPADGNEFVPAENFDELSVDFGSMLRKTPDSVTFGISATNSGVYESIDFHTIFQGSRVVLRPTDTLQNDMWYQANIDGIYPMDADEASPVVITFKTTPEGYIPPEIRIISPEPGASFRQNTMVTISALAQSEIGIEKTEYFIGNQKLGEGESVQWVTPKSQGEYVITARTTDVLGGISIASVTVTVEKNELPSVEFIGLSEGDTVDYADFSEISVVGSDTDGFVEKITLYVNGEIMGETDEAEITFPLTNPSIGKTNIKAVVSDNEGGFNAKEITIIVSVDGISYVEAVTDIYGNSVIEHGLNAVNIRMNDVWLQNGQNVNDLLPFAKLTCETGEVEITRFQNSISAKNVYTLRLKNVLDGGCTYKLSIRTSDLPNAPEVIAIFSTTALPLDITSYRYENEGNITFYATITNQNEIQEKVRVVLVTLDADGRAVETLSKIVMVQGGGKTNVSVASADDTGKAVKSIAYVIDDWLSGRPVTNRIFSLN